MNIIYYNSGPAGKHYSSIRIKEDNSCEEPRLALFPQSFNNGILLNSEQVHHLRNQLDDFLKKHPHPTSDLIEVND